MGVGIECKIENKDKIDGEMKNLIEKEVKNESEMELVIDKK